MLGEKIARHGVSVWLINTGWSGGPYGVGQRMSIANTRAMAHAVLDGGLSQTTPLLLNKTGKYVLFCPLTDRNGGKPHFEEGMLTTVDVR